VGRDTSRDQSGDQAAWRDLVARLELPSAIDPADAPWPDRENLAPATSSATSAPAASDWPTAPTGTPTPPSAPDEPLNLRHDLNFVDFDAEDDEDQDHRYVPPYVPPQPKLDPVARGAWTALFGGPGYLFIATTLGWQVPGWAELAAIIAFITGFVILVSRLGDGPSRRDGPDQGAVV
jgi:hypothetical protein